MLPFFRHQQNKQMRSIASYLVILTMLFKVMMPIAHASTALSGKATGFMTAICSANNIGKTNIQRDAVYVSVDIAQQENENQPLATDTNKCSLCFSVDQQTLDDTNTISALKQLDAVQHFGGLTQSNVLATHSARFSIRAPPLNV